MSTQSSAIQRRSRLPEAGSREYAAIVFRGMGSPPDGGYGTHDSTAFDPPVAYEPPRPRTGSGDSRFARAMPEASEARMNAISVFLCPVSTTTETPNSPDQGTVWQSCPREQGQPELIAQLARRLTKPEDRLPEEEDFPDVAFRVKPVRRGVVHGTLKFRGRGKPRMFKDDFDFVE